ncbi:MAG: cytochrome P450 [Acidimicrobiia bacterium]
MLFDPYSADFQDNPYPAYARLRAETPAFYDDDWELTFFTRHVDVAGILKDRRFGREVTHAVPAEEIDRDLYDRTHPPSLPTWTRFIRGSFIDLEPPRHTRIRRLVQGAFTKRSAESYKSQIEALASSLMDAALDSGEMEAIADYATPIPLAMIASILGVPAQDQRQLVTWSHAIVRVFDKQCTPLEALAAEAAVTDFADYLTEHFSVRRQHPGDELIDALISARFEGDRLSQEELVATCILVLNAGHEATVHGIGNSLVALAAHPEQFRWLRDNHTSVARAVDELLRYDSPLQMFERWVLEDLDWGQGEAKQRLQRGTKVGLLFGSANRDESTFDEPDDLVLSRIDNPYVSFGGGIHYCVGAPLAKIEMEVALTEFARRVDDFTIPSQLDRVPSLVFRGVRALPMQLSSKP